MTSAVKKSILAIWIIAASVTLAYTWYYNPNLFPQVPESFSIWITDVASAKTAEDVALVGLIFGLVVSLMLVTCITIAAILICRCTSKPWRLK